MKASLPTKPMYCSREYFMTSRLIQQYEKPTAKYLLLQNEELLQLPERKVQILATIWVSLPITIDEAILQDIRVPDTYVAAITGVTASPFGEPGEATPQCSRSHVRTLAPWHITPKFLHPLALPAECLSATYKDLMSETEGESSSSESFESGSDEVHPSLEFPWCESKSHTKGCL